MTKFGPGKTLGFQPLSEGTLPVLRSPVGQTEGFEWGPSFSFSRRKTLKGCALKAAFESGLGIGGTADQQPLRMGSAFALCLEKEDPRAHISMYEDRLAAMAEGFSEMETLLLKESLAVHIMARAYLDHYGPADRRELYFAREYADILVPHKGEMVPLVNRGFADFGNTDVTSLGEDKFRAQWNYEKLRALLTDEQVTSMFDLAHAAGFRPQEMDYRVTIRPYVRKKDGVDEFRVTLAKQVKSNPAKFFISVPVSRSLEQIQAHRVRTRKLAEQLARNIESGVWDPNYDNCFQYGKLCEFHAICETGARGKPSPQLYYVKGPSDRDETQEPLRGPHPPL